MYYFKCILLIDDDPISKEETEEILKQLYIADEIKSVISAREGIEFIEEQYIKKGFVPQLILVDINRSRLNGFKFLELLQTLTYLDYESFKISALVSSSDPEDIEKMKKLRVHHYLIKPLNKKKLRELLTAINT